MQELQIVEHETDSGSQGCWSTWNSSKELKKLIEKKSKSISDVKM